MRTFQQFYQHSIDAIHATAFLEELLAMEEVEKEGLRLVAGYWQLIVSALIAQGIVGETVETRALLAYCLYWWQSFAKGYIREVAVFRDLEQSGVIFQAHDLSDPVQRRSAYDLTVLGQRGDIKTSPYFLHNARFFPLRSDFYMVRLYDEATTQWRDIVLLKTTAWQGLNGDPTPCTWAQVTDILPSVAQINIRGEVLVVVLYAEWKDRVLRKQQVQGDKR